MNYLILLCCVAVGIQVISAQILRPPPYNLLNRPVPETFVETGNFVPASPTVISEPPINSLVPLPNVISEPTTTLITDCSPTICKNLANTIQLMIVCNLLQNTKGNSDMALQLAAPILNEVMSSPTFSCGCPNPIPTLASISPNVISPNFINPNVVSALPANVIPNNGLPLPPRVVSPTVCPCNAGIPTVGAISPNVPLAGQLSNTNGLLNTLMGLLGNLQG